MVRLTSVGARTGAHSILAALLAGAGLSAFGALAACSKPFTMITEEWPPYVYQDSTETRVGMDIELVRAIFQEAGCTLVEEAPVPSARRLLLFQQGKFDLMLAASNTPERRRFANFSIPYRHESVALYALREDGPAYRAIDSFDATLKRGLSLLAPRTGWYGPDFARTQAAFRAGGMLYEFENNSQGVRMLSAGRAKLMMGDTAAVEYEARLQKVALARLPFVVLSAPVHLMLSKSSTTSEDRAQLDAAIGRLEKSGVLRAIRQRYGAP